MEKRLYFVENGNTVSVKVQSRSLIEKRPYWEVDTPFRIVSERDGYFVFENIEDWERFHHGLGRMGVMDSRGRVLVEPQWTRVEIMPKEGPAEVFVMDNGPAYFFMQDVKSGHRIRGRGELLGFQNGVGQTEYTEEVYGLLDVAWDMLTFFLNRSGPREETKFHNIDINGEILGRLYRLPEAELDADGKVISYTYKGYNDGLMPIGRYANYDYVDHRGDPAFTKSYLEAGVFSEGLAVAAPKGRQQRKREQLVYGVLNTKGEWVVKPQYNAIDTFRNGYARVWDAKSDQFGFLNKNGEVCVPLVWDEAGSFGKDGLAPVRRNEPPQFAMIDGNGQVRCSLPVDAEECSHYCEGRMRAVINGKVGYLDYSGGWAVSPRYDQGTHFHSGVALVKEAEEFYFIDPDGTILKALDEPVIGVSDRACWTKNKVICFGWDATEPVFKMSDWVDVSEAALDIVYQKMEERGARIVEKTKLTNKGDYIVCYEGDASNAVSRLCVTVDGREPTVCDAVLAVKYSDGALKSCTIVAV